MYYEYYVRTPQNKTWLFVLPGCYEFDIMTQDANDRKSFYTIARNEIAFAQKLLMMGCRSLTITEMTDCLTTRRRKVLDDMMCKYGTLYREG